MPYIFLLLFTLLFTTACNNSAIEPTVQNDVPAGLPITNQTTDVDDLKIIPENSIVGEYILQHGLYSNESIRQELNEGYLVIEELDVDNYGYYYATVINGLAETYLGIFFKKDGKFVQKVIYDDNGEPKIAIQDNIDIKLDGDILKIIIDDAKHQVMVWKRDDGTATKSDKLKQALKEAKNAYRDFYKEKCKTGKIQCAEHEFTPINSN